MLLVYTAPFVIAASSPESLEGCSGKEHVAQTNKWKQGNNVSSLAICEPKPSFDRL